jgi:hypothetical protein
MLHVLGDGKKDLENETVESMYEMFISYTNWGFLNGMFEYNAGTEKEPRMQSDYLYLINEEKINGLNTIKI